MNQFNQLDLQESYISAQTVPTLPNTLVTCDVTYVFTQERSHTHARSAVVNTSDILQLFLFTCPQFILLDKLHCSSALIVLTLPNIVRASCDNTYVLTPERSHTHVRSVDNASLNLQVVLVTCAQFILLDKLHCISALIVLTLPLIVLVLCGKTYVFTQERSHTHVRSVGSALHILQVVTDIYIQCIQRPHLINSIAIPVPMLCPYSGLYRLTPVVFKI